MFEPCLDKVTWTRRLLGCARPHAHGGGAGRARPQGMQEGGHPHTQGCPETHPTSLSFQVSRLEAVHLS